MTRSPRLPLLRTALALGLLAGFAGTASAQRSSDGTLYSRFGIGALESFASSQIQGMGGGGVAMPSLRYTNFANPATWSTSVLTRFSGGVTYQDLTATDAGGDASRLTSGQLGALHFSFPVLTNKLGVGLAFEPYSRVSYRVPEAGTLAPAPNAPDTVGYTVSYEGSGGLQAFRGGVGYRVSNRLSLGAEVDVLFGILENSRRTTFDPDDAVQGYAPTTVSTSTRLVGVSGTVGALLTLPGVLRAEDALAVGATLALPTRLSGDRVRTLGQNLDRDTLGTKVDGSVDLPLSAGLGLAYQPDPRWTLLADGRYEPWGNFSSTFALPGYDPDGDATGFKDRLRASAGVEWVPAGDDFTESYLQRTAYRLGFYYDGSYLSLVPDAELRTLALTGGVSLPTLLPGTRLDLNLEIGRRGTTDAELVQETFYRVFVNVNIGERWFEKRKLR